MNKLRIAARVSRSVLSHQGYLGGFIFIWLVTLWLFNYLTSLDLFGYVFSNQALTAAGKIRFLIDSMLGILSKPTEPRAFSIIIFSLLASLNIILMVHLIRHRAQVRIARVSHAGAVAAMVGAHCVACGGSLLAPVLTSLAGTSAYFSSSRIGWGIWLAVIINVVGIILIGRSTVKVANQTAKVMPQLLGI